MLINKLGLAEGRESIDPEVEAFNFKPYVYTDLDAHLIYEKTEVCNVSINKPFKIKNSVLTIDQDTYEIGDKTLQEVFNIVNMYGTMNFFTGYESFRHLPALLLNDCNNTVFTTFDGDVSPLDISRTAINKSLVNIVANQPIITIYDYDSNQKKDYNKVGSKIFFNPSLETKVHVQVVSKTFNLTIDMSPRRITNPVVVSTLLNYGEVI